MKSILSLLSVILLVCTANAKNPMIDLHASGSGFDNSPEVCQFSLTHYSGVINASGNTGYFRVGLSCPQQYDIRATVVVFIDNEHVASKVVKVEAGKDYSSNTYISVGTTYKGKPYRLVVK